MRLLFLLRFAIFIFILCWIWYNQIPQKSKLKIEGQIARGDKSLMRNFSKTFSKIYNPDFSELISKKTKFRDY